MSAPSQSRPDRHSPSLVVVSAVTAVALTAFLRVQWRLSSYAPDDAYISLRYAEHLAQGHGLVYNLSERVEGYTNFLWTAFLAIPFAIHVNAVLFMKVTSAWMGVASAFLLWRLGPASGLVPRAAEPARAKAGAAHIAPRGRPRVAAPAASASRALDALVVAAPALLFLATPVVGISAAEGLETMCFVFLMLLSLTLFFGEGDTRPVPFSALAAAALAMTRPDGVFLGPLLFAAAWALRRQRRYLFAFALTFVVAVGGYQLARWLYYGQPFPNTLYAKGGGGLLLAARGWAGFTSFFVAQNGWVWLVALAAFRTQRTRVAAALIAAAVLARVAFQVWSGGPWQGHDRFLVPALPLLDLLLVAGIAALLKGPDTRVLAIAVAAAVLLFGAWQDYPRAEGSSLGYAQALAAAHMRLGADVRAGTSPDAVLAMDDAGAGPYLSERTNIDMLGLNDAHIAHLKGRFLEKYDTHYILERAPDLVVLLGLVPEPTAPAEFRLPGHAALFREPAFQARYRLARRYAFARNYNLLVFRRNDSRAVPAGF